MKQKTYTEEQIIRIFREADQGKTVRQLCKDNYISDQTYYRWKEKYGQMVVADVKRLRELEKENLEFKKTSWLRYSLLKRLQKFSISTHSAKGEWYRKRDLNPRPPRCKRDALPTELFLLNFSCGLIARAEYARKGAFVASFFWLKSVFC